MAYQYSSKRPTEDDIPLPRGDTGKLLPESYEDKSLNEREKDRNHVSNEEEDEALMQEMRGARNAPVWIKFTLGRGQQSLDMVGQLQTTVEATQTIKNVYDLIKKSESAAYLASAHELRVPKDVRSVVVNVYHENYWRDITFRSPCDRQARIWDIMFEDYGFLASSGNLGYARPCTIEINLDYIETTIASSSSGLLDFGIDDLIDDP